MDIIHASSVSDGFNEALWKVRASGIKEASRNGDVLVMPGPVMTIYYNPQNRVLFSAKRDANPFFHLMEALWMLAGRNDLLFPLLFNKRFREYSDDGATIWGAYGWRWKSFFQYDQLEEISRELTKNPSSRRCVLAMWNAMPHEGERDPHSGVLEKGEVDLNPDLLVAISGGKDVPCNTHAYFDCRGGVLNMTVCNRSNDMLWGCYGANAVHFSVLHEYMAAKIGVPVGVYRQFSNNLHLYLDVIDEEDVVLMAHDLAGSDRYNTTHRNVEVPPMIDCDIKTWEKDLQRFIKRDGLPNDAGWTSPFFIGVARPMYMAHEAWRNRQYDEAMDHAKTITAWDWRLACVEWLNRRAAKREEKANA